MKGYYIFLLILIIFSCENRCREGYKEVRVFHGLYFKAGQFYRLNIDNGRYKEEKNFSRQWSRGDYHKITTYCTNKDSILIEFFLDDKDTSFFIKTNRFRKLVVGTDAYGDFSIGTDEDKRFWEGWKYPD